MTIALLIMVCLSTLSAHSSASCMVASLDDRVNRVNAMQLLIQTYKRYHSRATLEQEAITNPSLFCSRNFFIPPRTAYCGSLGNGILPNLGSFGLAIVTNRTLVFHSGFHHDSCIGVRKWPIEFPELEALHSKAKCIYPISSLFIKNKAYSFSNEMHSPLEHYHNDKNYSIGTVYDYSCYIDKITHKFLTIGGGGQEEVLFRLFRKSINAALGTNAQQVIDILLSSPVYFQSHFESMGLLFSHLYRFNHDVINYTHLALSKVFLNFKNHCTSTTIIPNTIVIGMHVRHQRLNGRLNPSDDEPVDNRMIGKLEDVLNGQFMGRKCVLLLASDRLHTLRNISRAARSFGCEVITNPYPEFDTISKDCDATCLEHGPQPHGVAQLADVFLLGHAQYFIGRTGSTYSQTIAYLVAYNKLMNDPTANYTYIDVGGQRDLWSTERENAVDEEKWIKACPANALVRSNSRLDSRRSGNSIKNKTKSVVDSWLWRFLTWVKLA